MNNKSQEKFICIYRTPYYSQIVVMKSLLDAHKIPYFIENENFASLGPSDGAINFGVMVQDEYSEDAKRLLKDFIYPETKKKSEGSEGG